MFNEHHFTFADLTDKFALLGAWMALTAHWMEWIPTLFAALASLAAFVWYCIRIYFLIKTKKEIEP